MRAQGINANIMSLGGIAIAIGAMVDSAIVMVENVHKRIEAEPLDFVQLAYSINVRNAERRLLPLAADKGVAVLINRPFEKGALFRRVKGRPLPDWAAEFDCATWGQFFLKFILGHPAATCVIPGTGKPKHMTDNLGAGRGRLPDEGERRKMTAFWDSI